MSDKDKELCPRLIDYLVVVGKRGLKKRHTSVSNQSSSNPDGATKSVVTYPEIVRRYPIDDHKDFQLPTDVTVFCQPEGCITQSSLNRKGQPKGPQFFVFMLTEKDSAKIRYGMCLNFYRSFDRKEKSNAKEDKKKDYPVSLTSLCFISHHPFTTAIHQLLLLLKKIIDACNHRASLKTGAKDIIWSVLSGHWQEGIPPEAMSELKEIETWILMLLSSPVPVPGKTKVQLEVMPPTVSNSYEFALPDHTRFSLVDFPLHLPFELLGVDVAIKVLTAVMLEFKVLIQSRNYNAVSMCVLSFVNLLYPLEYMFPVIPLLPSYMNSAEQLLLAPTPFLIGIPSSFFTHRHLREIPTDVIIIDIDSNTITVPDDLYIPELPEQDAIRLKNDLRQALTRMSLSMLPNNSDSGNFGVDEVDIACRVSMVKFFNSANVFGNFSEHTRTLRLYPRPVVSLQVESFLRSRPQSTQFITDLCRTQAVEYFAECCLCPKNEAFVRIQAGIESAQQIGDKGKWFSDTLMPVHFQVYSQKSSLEAACIEYAEFCDGEVESDDEEPKSICSSSSMDEMVFASGEETETELFTKPLAEVNDVYKEPISLELPMSESRVSIGSSISSGRSSPASSRSASAMDSEADFAKLAENLALKSNSEGDFAFDHSAGDEDVESTPISQRRRVQTNSTASDADTPTHKNPTAQAKSRMKTLSNQSEKVLGPNFMNAINGIGEKGSSVFSQVLNKTAPKAQALKEKTMGPLANKLEQSQHIVKTATQQNMTSAQTASQQSKNQQQVREYCDQVLSGQGIGMFAVPKLKRLMEDESLRELACSKLNLGLENKLSEEEFVKEIPLTRAQYKGYVKMLKACIEGIETCFNSPVCSGLASVFHVLEIAHTHFWAPTSSNMSSDALSPSSAVPSALTTPMSSNSDISKSTLPAASCDMRTPTKPVGGSVGTTPTKQPPPAHEPPQLPPRQPSTSSQDSQGQAQKVDPSSGPPPAQAPPPPPPRPAGVPPAIAPRKPPPPIPPRPSANSQAQPNQQEQPHSNSTTNNVKPTEMISPPNVESKNTNGPIEEKKPTGPKMAPPTSLHVEKNKVSMQAAMPASTPVSATRHYIYQELLMSHPNPIWQNLQFWENAFVDVVAQERDIVGMDQEPSEMIDRYTALNDSEKKRLELEEDRLLSTLLHNMTAYMVMCGTGQRAIQQKIRRLLGKAHIGLVCSKEINKLLDELPQTQGNSIPLRPLGSRLVQKHSFTVYVGPAPEGPIMFMEVCDDSVVLRSVTGTVAERWWYERLVNMTYSPKTKVLCLWRRHEDKVHMHKFHTKKCRELYQCMKAAMERAAMRGKVSVEGRILGGEFPVHDTETNQGGLLQVRCDGIQVIFANSTQFIELANIKKCNTLGGTVFLLEEYDRKKGDIVQRRYHSQMAVTIAWELHRVFSVQYMAAINGTPPKKSSSTANLDEPLKGQQSQEKYNTHNLIFTDELFGTTR